MQPSSVFHAGAALQVFRPHCQCLSSNSVLVLGAGSSTHEGTRALALVPTLVSACWPGSFHRKHCRAHRMRTPIQLGTFASFHCCEPKYFRYLICFFSLFLLSMPLGVLEWKTLMYGASVSSFKLLLLCLLLPFHSFTPLALPCFSLSGKNETL